MLIYLYKESFYTLRYAHILLKIYYIEIILRYQFIILKS